MTSSFPDNGQYDSTDPAQVKKQASFILQSMGLSPKILDIVPNRIMDSKDMLARYGQEGAFYEPGSKQVFMSKELAQSPQTWLHEYMHALQGSLNETDQEDLRNIMMANPPEGSADAGFTNYPSGLPTQHHNLGSNWGLASYIDYQQGFSEPYAEQFRTSIPDIIDYKAMLGVGKDAGGRAPGYPATVVGGQYRDQQSWLKLPEEVLGFLKDRFPLNPSDLMKQGGTRNRTTASIIGNSFGQLSR